MKEKDQLYNKLWTPQFIKIITVSLLVLISYQMQTVTLPLYIQNIGGNRTDAGLVMSVFTISALLFRHLVGNLCDYKGRKIVFTVGIILFTIISATYNFGYFIWLLILLRFFHGASFSAFSTAGSTIICDVVPSSRIMEGIGYYGISGTLAATIGPAMALYLIYNFQYNILLWATAVISLVGFIIALSIKYEGFKPKEKKPLKKGKINYLEKTAVIPSLVMLFIAMAQISVITFLPSYAISLGINNIGLFFFVQALVMMFTRPIMGKLSDRYGAGKVMLPGMTVLLLSFIMMALNFNTQIFILIGVLNGLGYGTVYPVLSGITVQLCPEDRRGAANSTFYSAVDLGYGVGSFAWGALSQYQGFSVIYIASACSVGISLLFFLLKMKSKLLLTRRVI